MKGFDNMARGSWINESVCTESERERLLKYVGKKFSEDFIILEYIPLENKSSLLKK